MTEILNEIERALNAGELTFVPLSKATVPPFAAVLYDTFIVPADIPCLIADKMWDKQTVLFKLEDSQIPYMCVIDELGKFVMADEGFHNSLPINESMAYFASKAKDLPFGMVGQGDIKRLFDAIDRLSVDPELN